MPPVAFFGPSGTFTEEALLSQPDLAAGERVPLASIPDVLAAVERGDHELGVVPIENSIEGSVSVTLDSLIFEHDLLIQREVDLPISLNLFVKPGTTLRDVTTVLSYPHAIAQCRTWLSKKLPNAEIVAANSTAEAAQRVARTKKPGQAAIGNNLAASIYGLKRLAAEIEDHPENQTRFVVVGSGIPAPTRPRQDEHRLLPARRPAGVAARDPPGVLRPLAEPEQAREPPDQAEPRATTAS